MRHRAVTVMLLPTCEPVPWTMIGLPGMRRSSLKALKGELLQHWWRRLKASRRTTRSAPLHQRLEVLTLIQWGEPLLTTFRQDRNDIGEITWPQASRNGQLNVGIQACGLPF